ncbi:DUF4190 domain-containing protein [Paenactinomyces guangxiensis]|uniref:DUF4190 domain-containing protein n=1 Tax=Paenactinomyces guangxiensis TaxID=1490290 RepID=A0A7W2A938_9BACL|nr:DUF4190 domain-containing protein [Paenactinomyces guangxiensis]MBA4496231.1 hypothetical protein [Paenactinomyces guangxiensis]MBH8593664.1 hypothetical protein [Paenactinomyces guangxiensis]
MEPVQQPQSVSSADPAQNKKASISLVLGVLGVIGSLIYALAGVLFGAAGLIVSFSGRKSEKKNLATAGMVLSILGIALGAFAFVLKFFAF